MCKAKIRIVLLICLLMLFAVSRATTSHYTGPTQLSVPQGVDPDLFQVGAMDAIQPVAWTTSPSSMLHNMPRPGGNPKISLSPYDVESVSAAAINPPKPKPKPKPTAVSKVLKQSNTKKAPVVKASASASKKAA